MKRCARKQQLTERLHNRSPIFTRETTRRISSQLDIFLHFHGQFAPRHSATCHSHPSLPLAAFAWTAVLAIVVVAICGVIAVAVGAADGDAASCRASGDDARIGTAVNGSGQFARTPRPKPVNTKMHPCEREEQITTSHRMTNQSNSRLQRIPSRVARHSARCDDA